jgi:hypothetical protein
MNVIDFKRIVASFADRTMDIASDNKEIVVNIRDELIEIRLRRKDMELYVEENGVSTSMSSWIVNRLARIPMLADRIIDFSEQEPNFVCPQGSFLEDIGKDPSESQNEVENTVEAIETLMDNRNALASQVIYITSDAGEGKTTLINHLARIQAERYKRKESSWLLLPIPLGGRPFLRLDDIIIATLVNRFRFNVFYYDSFIELVKMGILVPALDGFEEMFMESSTGEALSSLGQLLNKLNSQGVVLIAARKAYFDYKSFATQARLFDSIQSDYVTFSRISLKRWDREQFVEYATMRLIDNPDGAYETLSNALQPSHPILTRAVLVKQLLDVFVTSEDFAEIARNITAGDSQNYFEHFVDAILQREANTKWLDRSGDVARPILTVDEHRELLSSVAQEMWINNTQSLGDDVMGYIADLFSETKGFTANYQRQIKERIKQHALIVRTEGVGNSFSFDHQEFYYYFIGVSLANQIIADDRPSLMQMLRVGILPQQAFETVVQSLKSKAYRTATAEELLVALCQKEGMVSFVRENLGAIFIRLLAGDMKETTTVSGLILPPNSLNAVELSNKTFKNCYFQSSGLENTKLIDCTFEQCRFDRLDLYETTEVKGAKLLDCDIRSVYDNDSENSFFGPDQVFRLLAGHGFEIKYLDQYQTASLPANEIDEEILLTERIMRRFLKSTQLNENIFRLRLGRSYGKFEDKVLPVLKKAGVLIDVKYDASGYQKRYKLGKPMSLIEKAFERSEGSFTKFIDFLS